VITLGFSPCPNDTFVFYALVHGLVPDVPPLSVVLADVESLNEQARRAALDVTKISYGAVPWLLEDYVLVRSGGAIGRGCGPLVVAREPGRLDDVRGTIAIPGDRTTAFLLLRLRAPQLGPFRVMPFSEIPRAVAAGEVAAGLIIHETRFTYAKLGLHALLDLGEWWESWTGLPIPLGGILVRRNADAAFWQGAIRRSVEWAFAHPEATRSYVKAHAQELEDDVMEAHIKLYVTEFTRDIGNEGEAAVRALLARAAQAGLVPLCRKEAFCALVV
jgi:1,4-dihydroxy-6-naphthoate synthase